MDFFAQAKAAILRGEWTAGQRLPSIRQMAALKRVSHHTVVSGYARLVGEGLLEAQQGRGYFVSRWACAADPAPPPEASPMADPLYRLLQATPDKIKLGCGWLPPSWRDTETLARAIRKTARSGQSALVEYGDIQGYPPLRKQLSAHLRRTARIEVAPQHILTTLGATQALDLILHRLVRPGDHVLVDEPCNGNLIQLIQLHQGIPLGVPRRRDGPDLDSLDRLLQARPIKAFFCNSTYHNPTGAGLSPQSAFQVLKRAIEHDFIIVEDDVYGDFQHGPRQTFAQLDDLDHVIYIGSFSKSLSASLRIGYIIGARPQVDALIQLKLLTSVAVPGFCERFVNTILADGSYARHIQDIQRKLMTRQRLAQALLKRHGWAFDIQPDGGMFLWAGHPDLPNLSGYIRQVEQQGVLLLPGSAFSVSGGFQDKIRINVAHLGRDAAPYLDVQRASPSAPPRQAAQRRA
ncbi:PLP-dependent aminotransferase family protein [Castellaniella hirudinis]|uniref:aminotransferase-like domain-containing protein n=1 Tax=Castellaniella hirudinis TaxID=1144617 RepID=UPI0039C4AF67